MGMDELDGNHAAQVGIGCPVNGRHTPLPEQGINYISSPDRLPNPILRHHERTRKDSLQQHNTQ
jgi:hypothetical protein